MCSIPDLTMTWELLTMTDTERKRRGSFARVHENAINATPALADLLPLYAAICGNVDGRITEWAACYLWRYGYTPPMRSAHVYNDTITLRKAPRQNVAPPDWNYTPKPHRDAIGQVCIDCHVRKPLTADFWDKDSTCKHGYKTQCKSCRRKYQRARYAMLRQA